MDWDGAKKELTEAAKKIIEERYTEKFFLETIAGALYVNESYLMRTFKEITGQTLLWYHNFFRCQKAQQLLTQQELSVSFISSNVGYCSPSHFTRIFKKMVGCTLSEYRNKYLQSLEQ